MRTVHRWNSYSHRNTSSRNNLLYWIIGAIVLLVILFKWFGGSSSEATPTQKSENFITITPMDAKSTVSIANTENKETAITTAQPLYTSDAYVLVDQGGATWKLKTATLDFDEKTQVSYVSSDIAWENISLNKGRVWIESNDTPIIAELKRLKAKIGNSSIAMIEQTNSAFSVVYAIQGNIDILTDIWQYTLKPGEGIKIADNNLTNASTKLADLVDAIDVSLSNNSIFIRNNGEEILKKATSQNSTENSTDNTQSGSTQSGSGSTTTTSQYIEFTQPTDGITLKNDTVTLMGNILHNDVARITINDVDTSVSPVNQTFVMQNFKVHSDVNNIVYKVYDASNNRLDMGVLVVYGPKGASAQETIIPQNYPISSNDFKISSPASNPYATTENYVFVQGKVPKNTVQYITVNDYRLQKFVPNSDTWYYHANGKIGTMKEGTNLYYIKFFDANNKLLYTQLFTIIKDSNTAPVTPTNNDALLPS